MQPKKSREAMAMIPVRVAPEDKASLESAAKEMGLISTAALVRVIVREFVASRRHEGEKRAANG